MHELMASGQVPVIRLGRSIRLVRAELEQDWAMARHRDDDEWFDLDDDLLRDPGEVPPKLKLLADVNISQVIIDTLRKAHIDIVTAKEVGVDQHDDADVLQRARELKRVLLTHDQGFWSDRKHPLRLVGGVVVLQPTGDEAVAALGLFLGGFALRFGRRWKSLKVLATPDQFRLKMLGLDGRNVGYEVRMGGGQFKTREIAPAPKV